MLDERAATSSRQTDEPPQADEPPVLDRAVIDGLRNFGGGATDMSERYVGLFLDEAATLFARVHAAASVGDLVALERGAHTLCGAAGFVGACQLAADASALEDAIRLNPSGPGADRLGILLATLTAAYTEAIAALESDVPAAALKRSVRK